MSIQHDVEIEEITRKQIMNVIFDEIKLQRQLHLWQVQGFSTALVPIMEPLHQGHFTLISKAKQHAQKVIVCTCYPKTLLESLSLHHSKDYEMLSQHSLVDLIYEPETQPLQSHPSWSAVPYIADVMTYLRQPRSFRTIAKITCRLLNQVRPTVVCLSEKDFQQMMVIRHMIADLSMPVHIISVPTQREHDGLAISACNQLLSDSLRPKAVHLKHTIDWMADKIQNGKPIKQVVTAGKLQLRTWGFKPDYLEVLNPIDLTLTTDHSEQLGIFAAVFLGKPRLSDHLIIRR